MNQGPFKTTILNNINKEFVLYDKPLEKLEKIKIVITDPYGRLLNIQNDFSMTIQINESINVLSIPKRTIWLKNNI